MTCPKNDKATETRKATIRLQDNVNLYKAVELLTSLSSASNFDTSIFKAVDKVCQMMYNKHKETK